MCKDRASMWAMGMCWCALVDVAHVCVTWNCRICIASTTFGVAGALGRTAGLFVCMRERERWGVVCKPACRNQGRARSMCCMCPLCRFLLFLGLVAGLWTTSEAAGKHAKRLCVLRINYATRTTIESIHMCRRKRGSIVHCSGRVMYAQAAGYAEV